VHVSEETRAFVLEHLKLGLSIYQVMNMHKCKVKEMMENNGELSRDLFLSEQDIHNLARELAKETYKKHEMMHRACKCGLLKTKTRFSFTKRVVGKLKAAFKIVICLSPLAYKPNCKSKCYYNMAMKVVFLLMPPLE